MAPEERAREGVFLAFQYPVEIPGRLERLLPQGRAQRVRKHRGLPELDAIEFLALVKREGEARRDRRGPRQAAGQRGLLRRREEAQRDLPDGACSSRRSRSSTRPTRASTSTPCASSPRASTRCARPERSMIVVTHYQRLLELHRSRLPPRARRGPDRPLRRQGARPRARGEGLRVAREGARRPAAARMTADGRRPGRRLRRRRAASSRGRRAGVARASAAPRAFARFASSASRRPTTKRGGTRASSRSRERDWRPADAAHGELASVPPRRGVRVRVRSRAGARRGGAGVLDLGSIAPRDAQRVRRPEHGALRGRRGRRDPPRARSSTEPIELVLRRRGRADAPERLLAAPPRRGRRAVRGPVVETLRGRRPRASSTPSPRSRVGEGAVLEHYAAPAREPRRVPRPRRRGPAGAGQPLHLDQRRARRAPSPAPTSTFVSTAKAPSASSERPLRRRRDRSTSTTTR